MSDDPTKTFTVYAVTKDETKQHDDAGLGCDACEPDEAGRDCDTHIEAIHYISQNPPTSANGSDSMTNTG